MSPILLEYEQIMTSETTHHNDKRYFPRWEVKKRIEYREEGWPAIQACTKDLSLDGASIFVLGNPPARRIVQLRIHLANKDVLKMWGRVAWRKKEATHKLVGIIFEKLSERTQEIFIRHAFELRADCLLCNG